MVAPAGAAVVLGCVAAAVVGDGSRPVWSSVFVAGWLFAFSVAAVVLVGGGRVMTPERRAYAEKRAYRLSVELDGVVMALERMAAIADKTPNQLIVIKALRKQRNSKAASLTRWQKELAS